MIKESDIRDIDKVKSFFEKEFEWLSQFSDKEGLINKDYTVEIKCPCCGADNGNEVLRKSFFRFKECEDCNTIYVSPRFTQDMIYEYYKTREKRLNYLEILTDDNNQHTRVQKIFNPRRQFVQQTIINHGVNIAGCNLLDIGCASGQFLLSFNHDDIDKPKLFGIEASADLAEKAKKELPNAIIYSDSFEDCKFESGFFQIVTLWEVLEHVYNPYHFLKLVFEILKPGGFLFLTLPNLEGFDFQILWDKGNAFSPPSHINYYRKSTVSILFERVGLIVEEISTPGQLDVDIVKNRLDVHSDVKKRLGTYWYDILNLKSKEGDVLREMLQAFLKDNGLSSNMMIVCRKPLANLEN